MGVVFKARQVSLNRIVAVKMLVSGQFARKEFVERSRAEARAAANLQHPNIVAIHEVGEHDGQQYFSMDYVEGPNLAQVARDQPLPGKQAAALLKTIAEAVHYAHQRGVIHRDLKPSNVLLDGAGQPHVADFGLAKRLADPELGTQYTELTVTGQVLGTPAFMSSEQAGGRRGAVTTASDVYSLGALLYFLLAGRAPFAAGTLEETLRQVHESEPASPRLLNPAVPRDLETIALKCLAKTPTGRYESAQALADDLGRFLNDETIRARPAGRGEKLWRWCQRRPAVASLGFLLLGCLALGVTGVAWQCRRAEHTARESRDRLVRLQVANGNRCQETDDLTAALLWFSEAIRLEPDEDLHRIRFGSALRQCPKLVGLWARQGPFYRAMFSPDGSKVAIVDYQHVLDIVAADTGTLITSSISHRDHVRSIAFSPDGLKIFTTFGKAGRAWSATNGQPLGPSLPLNNSTYSRTRFTAAFSPDGKRLVARYDDRNVRIWDPITGQPLTQPMSNSGHVSCATFSPDGSPTVHHYA